MNNKLNLIFDFNNMAMRAMFTCNYIGGGAGAFDTDKECDMLIHKISTDMAYIARLFNPDRIIVACDAINPWRKEAFEESKLLGADGYKGNRVKDTTKNWDKIWKCLNEFKEILKNKNFIVTELPHGEADDVASLWKSKCFNEGENVLLVSSDKDWLQLVECDGNKFCACFNPIANNKSRKKLFVTQNFITWMNSISISNAAAIFYMGKTSSSLKETFKNIKSKDIKIEYEPIVPANIVLEKIMCGDDGDNVPAIYQYYKNGKKTRITPAKSKKILEDLNILNVNDLCMASSANALKPKLEEVLKRKLDDVDMDERVMRQRKFVELNSVLFPNELNEAFEYHAATYWDKGFVNTADLKYSDILKDTKFLSVNYDKPKESAIFDNLKDLEKYIKTPQTLF